MSEFREKKNWELEQVVKIRTLHEGLHELHSMNYMHLLHTENKAKYLSEYLALFYNKAK